MNRKIKQSKPLPDIVQIEDLSHDGAGIGKHNGMVLFVSDTMPGDKVLVNILKKKSGYAIAEVREWIQKSPERIPAPCEHASYCGGCSWQELPYNTQLHFKEKHVRDCLDRIAKVSYESFLPIVGCEAEFYYRNKLEFSFTHRQWVPQFDKDSPPAILPGLGFHIPKKFDQVFHVNRCLLMDEQHNKMRNFIHERANALSISYYNARTQEGHLRNLIIRNTLAGNWLVLLVSTILDNKINQLLDEVAAQFPCITSLLKTQNTKVNDTLAHLTIEVHKGKDYIVETWGKKQFKISAPSFFQTNGRQAERLYQIAKDFAQLSGQEVLYDLYTGAGSIALYLADGCKKVVGIEYVPEAIADAKINAGLNKIEHAHFFSGDIKEVLSDTFIEIHGRPDVVITDPPRAGMHADVVAKLNVLKAKKLVYISCNPSTQARDLAMLSEAYIIKKVQPVDMFPQTTHVETVVLLQPHKE